MKKLTIILTIALLSTTAIFAQSDAQNWDILGSKIEVALNTLDGSFEKHFHRPSFIDKIVIQNPSNEDVRKFNAEFKKNMLQFSFSRSLAKLPIEYAYKYVGFKKDSSLVIRQWSKKDEGFNYLFLKIEEISEYWMVVDIYVVSTGDFMSTTMKNTVYMAGILRLIDSKNGEKRYSNLETYLEANDLFHKGEYNLAYSKVSEIPLANRLKAHQIFKLNVAAFIVEDENQCYLRSISEYEELFPNDPSLQLLLLDKYTLDGEHQKTLEALHKLKDYVLNDNYLNYYKSMIYILLGDYDSAEKQVRMAIQKEPKEITYLWKLIVILEVKGHYGACIQTLEEIKKQSSYSYQNIAEIVEESYAYLFESKEYQNWFKKK